ncbi:MAG: hypothetical protein ACK6DA_02840 [Candidatus Kapaibacterium sp.]|jgi:hypothetical protein
MPIENQAVILYYNGTPVTPSPLITSIAKQISRTQAGMQIGCGYTISLQGLILRPDPTAFPPLNVDTAAGISNIMEAKKTLLDTFNCDGDLLIECDGDEIFKACCRVLNISFQQSPDNMVFSLPYTIELETNSISSPDITCCVDSSITSYDESWDIILDVEQNFFNIAGELSPKRTFNITHNVRAQAKDTCTTGDISFVEGWKIAKDKVESALGWDTGIWYNTNVGGGCIGSYDLFNHIRTNSIGVTAGEYSVTETWVLAQNTGDIYSAREDFTVDIQASRDSRLRNISVQGTIVGYESGYYSGNCYTITKNKYESALEYWGYTSGILHTRCQTISGESLTPVYTTFSHTHSPVAGQITYAASYETDNFCLEAPSGCTILNESIDVTDQYPTDVYAELQILGRPCPILQCLGIKTKGSKTINATLVLDCGKLCPGDSGFITSPAKPTLDDLINDWYDYLTGQYDSVYTDVDQESWNPKTGAYSRSISFSFSDCCTGVG